MQAVRQRQAEFGSATAVTRHIAEQEFLQALQVFAAFVLDGRLPDECAAVLERHSDDFPGASVPRSPEGMTSLASS